MRKIILIATILMSTISCFADGRKEVVTVRAIPAAGQQILNTYFADLTPSYAVREKEFGKVEYEVRFADGTEIDFDADGNWKKIDCQRAAVPEGLVPAEIVAKVQAAFPGVFVVDIEKERRGYDAELSNGLDVKFDRKFNMVIDD